MTLVVAAPYEILGFATAAGQPHWRSRQQQQPYLDQWRRNNSNGSFHGPPRAMLDQPANKNNGNGGLLDIENGSNVGHGGGGRNTNNNGDNFGGNNDAEDIEMNPELEEYQLPIMTARFLNQYGADVAGSPVRGYLATSVSSTFQYPTC